MTYIRADGKIYEKDESRTPPEIFAKLDAEFNFDFDAAANEHNSLCKDNWLQNGLEDLWTKWGGKVFFCNPPYSYRQIIKWVHKAYLETGHGATVVLLIPSDVSTEYFDFCFNNANEIRFLQPRVRFNRPDGTPFDGSPQTGSMVVVFRPEASEMAKCSIWKWKKPKE